MSGDQSNPAYSVERVFPVDVDRMWRAWTDAAELEQWYAPTDLSVVPGSVASEPVVGGRWAVAVDATAYGHIAYFWGRYGEVTPGSRLVHSMSASAAGGGCHLICGAVGCRWKDVCRAEGLSERVPRRCRGGCLAP